MVKLFIRDNTNGFVHEYGTNHHDSLIVVNGGLQYENLHCGEGTMFGSYSFCYEDGSDITVYEEMGEPYPYADIGGDGKPSCKNCDHYHTKRCRRCKWGKHKDMYSDEKYKEALCKALGLGKGARIIS